jgi:uncharacterized protein
VFRRRFAARPPAGGAGPRTVRASVLTAALAAVAAGCATLGIVELAPNGLPRPEDSLRRLLATSPDSALKAVQRKGSAAPRDALLRHLYEGAALHYAGDYRRSGQLFDRAYFLTQDRFTRSVSRGAASLLTNDRALAYVPSRTERLVLHYYAALGYLLAGEHSAAAVEARRLAELLAREQERGPEGARAETVAFFRYFTGAVFEAAGEWNDADVAYRNALRLSVAPDSLPDLDELRTTSPPPDSGDVIVFIEEGFVAHKVENSLVLLLLPEEVQALAAGSAAEVVAAAAVVSTRVLLNLAAVPVDAHGFGQTIYVPNPGMGYSSASCQEGDTLPPVRAARSCGAASLSAETSSYLLSVAWPQFVRERRPTAAAAVLLTGDASLAPVHAADLSAGVMADLDDQKALILARAIARGASKFAATKKAEQKATKEKGETTGEVVGLLTNIAGAVTERADTRSWHLLPERVSAMRVRLPAGAGRVEVRFDERRVVQLDVSVPAGGYAFASARGWR